jgi:hypothetical protein
MITPNKNILHKGKNLTFCISSLMLLMIVLTSCEESLNPYSVNQNKLYFSSGSDQVYYSFAYYPNIKQDTVWLDVHAIGFMTDYDRSFEMEQVTSSDSDAVAGVHYQSFTDEALQKYYVIKANTVKSTIPVVIYKDESLNNGDVKLKIKIKDNENFISGFPDSKERTLYISNDVVKPSLWSSLMNNFFGPYGKVKHKFMIAHTGKKWNDEYLENELYIKNYRLQDQSYIIYLAHFLQKSLNEENERRAAQGLGQLTEENNTVIYFTK